MGLRLLSWSVGPAAAVGCALYFGSGILFLSKPHNKRIFFHIFCVCSLSIVIVDCVRALHLKFGLNTYVSVLWCALLLLFVSFSWISLQQQRMKRMKKKKNHGSLQHISMKRSAREGSKRNGLLCVFVVKTFSCRSASIHHSSFLLLYGSNFRHRNATQHAHKNYWTDTQNTGVKCRKCYQKRIKREELQSYILCRQTANCTASNQQHKKRMPPRYEYIKSWIAFREESWIVARVDCNGINTYQTKHWLRM